jgi:hypothetical protein
VVVIIAAAGAERSAPCAVRFDDGRPLIVCPVRRLPLSGGEPDPSGGHPRATTGAFRPLAANPRCGGACRSASREDDMDGDDLERRIGRLRADAKALSRFAFL